MEEDGRIKISVCEGDYDHINGRLVRAGKRVVIKRPGRESKVYKDPGLDSFMALTDLIWRHKLAVVVWNTMLGYTAYWTPGTRANEEVGGGDER